MTAHPALRTPARPMPVTRIVAAMVAMAVVTGVLSTYALFALRPELFAPRGPAGPGAPPVAAPTATPDPTASPTPTATPSPTPSPTPDPTPWPTPVPAPVVTPAPAPTPPGTGSVLPPCAYMDVPTMHAGYGEWPITLLDTIYHLGSTYAPSDLVDSSSAGLNGGYLVRALVVADLAAMAADARVAGVPIALVSGYRSHAQQAETFAYWVSRGGYEQALQTSARAGHSEHQLGTTIDVTSEGGAAPWEYADWATTPAGAWMAANAWRYGFVLSYPAGAFDRTCYDYEPWHFRYVGRDLAERIAASSRTPREVLWELQ
jgi:D-alanyl-D-alanine carboxypeptidase